MSNVIFRLVFPAVLALAAATGASAQFAVVDQMGQPFQVRSYTDVRGSAYLYDTWMKGSVTTNKDITYVGIELMYDLVADELMFRSESGQPKTFIQPITEFSISVTKNGAATEQIFRRGFIPVDAANPNTFYEVLADGKAQLLKRTTKSIFEELPYGSSTKVKTFQSETHYYIARNEKLIKIKKDKKSVLKALGDKENELEAYIKNNRIDVKNEEALANLVSYYNTLK